jgi:hypothetical protein
MACQMTYHSEESIAVAETGVPLPRYPRTARSPVSRTLRPLRPGESIELELPEGVTCARVSRIAFMLWGRGAYRTSPTTAGKVRVWRLA